MPAFFIRCHICKKLMLWGQRCPNEGTDKHKVHDPSVPPRTD